MLMKVSWLLLLLMVVVVVAVSVMDSDMISTDVDPMSSIFHSVCQADMDRLCSNIPFVEEEGPCPYIFSLFPHDDGGGCFKNLCLYYYAVEENSDQVSEKCKDHVLLLLRQWSFFSLFLS